jgi:thiaminase (transcriptional activator TenA)
MTAARYGRAVGLWRAAAGGDWAAYVEHPFVAAMGRGDLPEAAFLRYLRQDYLFLIHFSRAWALAAAKAEDMDELAAAVAAAHALVHEETPLHVRLCAAKGIDAAALAATEEAPACMAYTRYVLEAGYSGDFLDLMAALAPCVTGYGEIGARLGAGPSPGGDCGDWIATYAGAPYQALCHDVGALIDRALARRLGAGWAETPRAARLSRRFREATRLEAAFWDVGLPRA